MLLFTFQLKYFPENTEPAPQPAGPSGMETEAVAAAVALRQDEKRICSECKKPINQYKLREHLLSHKYHLFNEDFNLHHGEIQVKKRTSCPHCGAVYKSWKKFVQHVAIAHKVFDRILSQHKFDLEDFYEPVDAVEVDPGTMLEKVTTAEEETANQRVPIAPLMSASVSGNSAAAAAGSGTSMKLTLKVPHPFPQPRASESDVDEDAETDEEW